MRRREFIEGLCLSPAWPLAARGQVRARVVGILIPYPEDDEIAQARFRVFRQELARLGWSEGRDVQLDVRWTTDNMDRVRAEATSLIQMKPDVIACNGDRVVAVFRQLTSSIPIVAVASELAGSGFVESLARPGANVTGFSTTEFTVIGKMVETLRQLAPGVSRVGMIYNPDNPVGAVYWRAFDAVATRLGLQPVDFRIHGVADIERDALKPAIATEHEITRVSVPMLVARIQLGRVLGGVEHEVQRRKCEWPLAAIGMPWQVDVLGWQFNRGR